ncbi:MAG: TPM domain-containing protein [Bryobacteraceae bacterium]
MKFPALAVLLALAAPFNWALDTAKLRPTGYMNDFAHVLPESAVQAIDNYCANVERSTGAQLAIVTVDTLEDEPVEDVAVRLYREWGIGTKGKDEGVLLLLSVKDRKTRAEVGYGLEPVITDGQAGDILRDMRPILRQGNYAGAIAAAVQQVAQMIAQSKGVQITGTERVPAGRRARPEGSIPFPLVILGFVFLLWLLGRGGGNGGSRFLTGMLLGNMMGRRGGWGGGGFGGYDGSGGGGFGGFGGGDSGGGGASSDW